MPDESCRTCGGTLINCSLCPSCRKMTQRICNMCGFKTKEQIHSECLHVVSTQTRNRMKINVISPVSNQKNRVTQKPIKAHTLRNVLLISGIVSFFVLGFATANYFDFFQSKVNEVQVMKTMLPQPLPQSSSQPLPQNHDNLPRGS